MEDHMVYLFYSPDCRRNWLAYKKTSYINRATILVKVKAESGSSAKNKAITAANNRFDGVEIIKKNFDDKLWGINAYPELSYLAQEFTS